MQDITNTNSYYLQGIHNFIKTKKMETQTEKHHRESKIINEALPFLKSHPNELKFLNLCADSNVMDKACMVAQIMGDYYESKKSEWIERVKKLPEWGQGVLVALNTGLITIAYRTKDVSEGFNQEYSWQLFGDKETSLSVGKDDYVTHWMPLPTAPKTK